MIELKGYPAIAADGTSAFVTAASGPVIIKAGRVLLDKHGDDAFWKFPGGRVRDTESLQATALREVAEELALTDVVLSGDPVVFTFHRFRDGVPEFVTLYHYRASTNMEPKAQRDVREVAWHPIDALPEDCAPNIKPVMEAFKQMGL